MIFGILRILGLNFLAITVGIAIVLVSERCAGEEKRRCNEDELKLLHALASMQAL